MIKYVIQFLSVFASVAYAQEHSVAGNNSRVESAPVNSLFSRQLQLVDTICRFIRSDLKLDIPDDFYTEWSRRSDSMFVYLYVSQSDKIRMPDSLHRGMVWSFESEDSAIAKSNELIKRGYQTLVYKTAGMSDALLSRKLLSYPDEAIAFILFHEAVHRHIKVIIPYQYIESLCDAMANAACMRFAETCGMLDRKKVIKQQDILENVYAFLNEKRKEADKAGIDEQPIIFSKCTRKINSFIKPANQFLKDRMGYKVNNAYFLRVEAYALHYFEMKQQLGENLDIDKVIEGLPAVKNMLDGQNKLQRLPASIYKPPQWDFK